MKSKFRFLSLLSRLGKNDRASSRGALMRLLRDEDGSYLLYMAFVLPVLIGVAGFGTEGSWWLSIHQTLQGAADVAAVSVGNDYAIDNSPDPLTQANAVITKYGFAANCASNGATCKVNSPALSGNYTNATGYHDCGKTTPITTPCSIEVIVTTQQARFFSQFWLSNLQSISARAVAVVAQTGVNTNCFLSLATTGTGIQANGGTSITVPGCGVSSNSSDSKAIFLGPKGSASISALTVGAVGGVEIDGGASITTGPSSNSTNTPAKFTGMLNNAPVPDPYAGVAVPSPSTCLAPPVAQQCSVKKGQPPSQAFCLTGGGNNYTLNPGTYCGGISMSANTVTLNPGLYIITNDVSTPGTLSVANGTVLNGSGVTLEFTSSDGKTYPTGNTNMMDLVGGSGGTLSAATTATAVNGAIPGIVLLGDRTMPVTTNFNVTNGSSEGWTLNGAVYLPDGTLSLSGGSGFTSACTQIIANTMTLAGGGTFQNTGCTGFGVKAAGQPAVTLVE